MSYTEVLVRFTALDTSGFTYIACFASVLLFSTSYSTHHCPNSTPPTPTPSPKNDNKGEGGSIHFISVVLLQCVLLTPDIFTEQKLVDFCCCCSLLICVWYARCRHAWAPVAITRRICVVLNLPYEVEHIDCSAHTRMCMHTYAHARTLTCMHAHMHARTHKQTKHTHTNKHTHTHTCTHTHTHTNTSVNYLKYIHCAA